MLILIIIDVHHTQQLLFFFGISKICLVRMWFNFNLRERCIVLCVFCIFLSTILDKTRTINWQSFDYGKVPPLISKLFDKKLSNRVPSNLIKGIKFEMKEYIGCGEASSLLKIKLNIVNLRANYKGKYTDSLCRRCGPHEE